MIYLYGIPNCDTVKKARTYLEAKAIPFEFIDFKKQPPTLELVLLWQKAFGGLPVNVKGQTYKKHAAEYEALSEKAKITFICSHSSMIKRPILQKDKTVLSFGFDEKDFQKKLGL
ncbi:MAG: Spx/MgsR family RNA polymerase-binding regulatory protein [Bdellovibrionales bacterium]|nr:Spx/MgsR family RNA polymerase-binding regulatory protein [Bdellovibrionales bacterium]